MFCTRCGHPNRDDARFCAECGASTPRRTSPSACRRSRREDEGHEEFPFPHDELEPGQALLLVKRGPNAGSTFLLEADETTVGREPDSAVFLDDVTVSRTHAIVERRGDGWFVGTSGSLNGTYVNGEQVDETKLATGDEVQIGKFKLTFFAAGRVSRSTWPARATTSRSARSSSAVKTEFPDITISKIRFLESEGLITPERTPSGYRKFYAEDVERLKSILRMQRDEYLPLKVIKERLLKADAGDEDERADARSRRVGGADAGRRRREELAEAPTGLQMSLEEMSAATGVDRDRIKELEGVRHRVHRTARGRPVLRRRRLRHRCRS